MRTTLLSIAPASVPKTKSTMFKRIWLVLALILLCGTSKATDIFFDLNEFNANPAFGRNVDVQPQQPIPGNIIQFVSDGNGQFTLSNARAQTDYIVFVHAQGSASYITFQVTCTATNLGVVDAATITSVLGQPTYPTGMKSAWTITAMEQRYQLNGTTLSNTFYPLFSNPSNYTTLNQLTNSITNAIPTNFWSPSAVSWISNLVFLGSITTNDWAPGTGMTATTNAGIITLNVSSQTNSFGNIVSSNASAFATTNQLVTASNVLETAITSAGISLATATNIAAGQVFSGTNILGNAAYSNSSAFYAANNPNFYMGGSSVTNLAIATTNNFGTASRSNTSAFYLSSNPNGYISGATVTNTVIAGTNGFGIGVYSNINAYLLGTNGTANGLGLAGTINITNATFGGYFTLAAQAVSGALLFTYPGAGSAILTIASNAVTSSAFVGNGGGLTNTSATNLVGIVTNRFVAISNGISTNLTVRSTGASIKGIDVIAAGTETFFVTDEGAHLPNAASGDVDGLVGIVNGNNNQLTIVGAYPIVAGALQGTGAGLTNIPAANISTNGSTANQVLCSIGGFTVWTNSSGALGFSLSTVTNVVLANAITNAFGTNRFTPWVTNGIIFIPTNWDTAGGSNLLFGLLGTGSNNLNNASNFLYATKMDETNSVSYGQIATNFATEGNVSFGFAGNVTNIYSTTNVLKFINAGTSLTTNGTFVWVTALNVYSNRVTLAICTNNGTAWNLETNGVVLYSLNGTSPVGTWTAGAGSGSPVSATSFQFDHNGMDDVGWLSFTNLSSYISNVVVTNVTSSTNNNFIANQTGLGTNTTLYNPNLQFSTALFGLQNTIVSGSVAAILSGQSNIMVNHSWAVIAGGTGNSMTGGSVNGDSIGGGASNSVGATAYGTVSGGFFNSIGINSTFATVSGGDNNAVGTSTFSSQNSTIAGGEYNSAIGNAAGNGSYSMILGGQSNITYRNFDTVGGANTVATNDRVFIWSDGHQVTSFTNSTVLFYATNGYSFQGGNADFTGITINGSAISQLKTNTSPVAVGSAVTTTMPVTLANSYGGRAQPTVQYYLVDAVGGTPVLTASNNLSGIKLFVAQGASAGITPETNFITLPLTQTNSIWTLRDESSGSGASVGVITNYWSIQ